MGKYKNENQVKIGKKWVNIIMKTELKMVKKSVNMRMKIELKIVKNVKI